MNNRSSSSREPGGSEEKTLAGDLESVRNLRAAKASAPLLDELANDIQALNERDLRAAVVCLVGPTGAGKSTLLNALAGVQVAQEGVDRPTTTTPVVYAPADIDELELGLQVDAKISRYQASADRPWSGHVLIDAPDVNSIRREHRDTVRALAAASDVLVVVLHHQAVVEEITTEFVDGWADRRRVAVVLNRVDQLSTDAAALLLAQVRETASERWGVDPDAVFGVSALRARENEGEDPGFRALVGWLAGLVDAGVVRGIRRTNREGTRRRLATEVGAIADATADDIGLIRSSLAEGWDTFADQANKDVARRLVVRRADVELALGAELAKRWRGPGGILLRIGMWGSVGTLGALALRRNPLAAGAFAVGGQVADKLRSSVAERRLE
ncbi:MAG: energy-coupling factor transporter ATP-binding protein EcfA2, partial [Hyphomicrobiaceae bacterium]